MDTIIDFNHDTAMVHPTKMIRQPEWEAACIEISKSIAPFIGEGEMEVNRKNL